MNVNFSQNNNAQSFGMALKLRNGAINSLSEIIQNAPNPEKMEQKVIRDILTPIKRCKTDVLVDDNDCVYVADEANGALKEIIMGGVDRVGKMTLGFKTTIPWDGPQNAYIDYLNPIAADLAKQSIDAETGLLQKLTIAREWAKNLDRSNILKSYSKPLADNPTAAKLKDLFG